MSTALFEQIIIVRSWHDGMVSPFFGLVVKFHRKLLHACMHTHSGNNLDCPDSWMKCVCMRVHTHLLKQVRDGYISEPLECLLANELTCTISTLGTVCLSSAAQLYAWWL